MANGKAGPPFKTIGKLEFEKLCALQCTQQEICDFFEVDHKTLTRWCKRTYKKDYSQIYAEKRSGGKIALRRLQMRLAEKSAAMAIFLGKNILGQSDEPAVDLSSAIAQTNAQIADLAAMLNHPQESRDVNEFAIDLPDDVQGDDPE